MRMYKIYYSNYLAFLDRKRLYIRAMKLCIFLTFIAVVQAGATALAQRVTLREQKAPLEKVFNDIHKQTGYDFFYDDDLLAKAPVVTVELKDVPLEQALKAVLGNGLSYSVTDKTITVKEAASAYKLKVEVNREVDQMTIRAKVTDELGNPLTGVTVRQKTNPNNGTTTDAKGSFTLTVPDNNTVISFSFIGYELEELQAKDISTGSVITLKASIQNLQEVVINKGYYDEKKELSTGDESVVNSKTIGEQPVSDPLQALEGQVPGLNIIQNSGLPGANATVQIRGLNSIANGNAPFYIVDGVPFTSVSLSPPGITNALGTNNLSPVSGAGSALSPFNALNPDDIESITVLKDADATAIYGSRGANGAILITTKKGKPGETKVDLDVNQGIGQVTRKLDLLNTRQYLEMRDEAYRNDGLAIPNITINPDDNAYDVDGVWDKNSYTDWQKVLIGNTANYTNIQGSISGGTINDQFLVGGTYNRQTTVFPGTSEDIKGAAHLNFIHTSTNKKFHFQFTASYVNEKNDIPTYDFTSLITLAPDYPAMFKPDGTINWQIYQGEATNSGNPAQFLTQTSTSVTNNLISNVDVGYEILPGLILKSSFGYYHDELNENWLLLASAQQPPYNTDPSNNALQLGNTTFQQWIIEPQLSYKKKVAKGELNITLGSTFQQNTQLSTTSVYYGFTADALVNDPLAASASQLTNYTSTLYRYNAVYARIGYDWDDKYLLNITARRDGSSRFGPDRQWGNFGAVGLGWIFSKEKFIQDQLPFLSFGKFRASYGITGNDQLTDYQYLSTYNANSSTYQGATYLSPTGLTNPQFGWETVKKLEFGTDLGFLKDRIDLAVNYYVDRTGNQLVGYPLPSVAGFTTIEYNLPAIVQNTGLEMELHTVNIKTNGFTWTTSANFTLPQNKLVAYPGLANSPYASTYVIGQSLFIQKVYDFTGVNPQTGYYSFATQNVSGRPSSPQDQVVAPALTQKFYGGLQNSFTYKNFSLDIFFQFVKQLGRNYYGSGTIVGGPFNQNVPTAFLQRWQYPGDVTNVSKFTTGTTSAGQTLGAISSSTGAITDASFIRLKNLALSYRLPKSWQQWAHTQNARVYLQAQNLLTITDYFGLDPETQGLSLPLLRMITLGVSASF